MLVTRAVARKHAGFSLANLMQSWMSSFAAYNVLPLGPYPQSLAVRSEFDRACLVRPQHGDTPLGGKPLQNIAIRVSEAVVRAHRDDCVGRGDC